ncbi:BTAD domain-containing putative transcriptional regulator [Phytomonospora endophytica]|uniref:Putative ATPase/DNA-binding SARP family transcriptional activator n=1 Tax=Phytomonospora endophytica TaxID=714109 RepID=A0A841FWX3_9ACTN|nr:BTAD domain-containing putative transcriptional regulator [Phytomonospora endophytica]MBB6036979.1 putative ATPase/DNA-binding SARP family transcriptional activator [Phytomonospora endophytica]GIG67990.1 SARP family transcriptional regulator [Phytomonospora endophytica]
MRFGVLGAVTVWTDDGTTVAVPERKVRALLALLLTDPGRVFTADRLIDAIWPKDPPAKPANALQRKISELRKALDAAEPGARELVAHRPPGYLLRVTPADTDAGRFTAALDLARRTTDPTERADLAQDALALWRGPAYADVADEPYARPGILHLDDARLDATEILAETLVELARHAEALTAVGDLAERHPARPRLIAARMRALYHSGRVTEALDTYAGHHRTLTDDLGLDPDPGLADLHRALLRRELDAPVGHHIPRPAADLIGREDALADIHALLGESRLVTLTGPGGVGKTRLALEAAHHDRDSYPGGVRTVELAALPAGDDPATVAEAVMAALRVGEYATTGPLPPGAPVTPAERVVQAVRDRQMLLVLDNCEHVVGAVAALVSRLLTAAPGLTVLATSQEPLAVAGETLHPVSPLDLPEHTAGIAASGAVRLFTARVAATVPDFTLTDANAPAVAAVCRRLDGIPLALELAAPRVAVLGVEGLLERLDDRFGLLTGGYRDAPTRQRTLRAMIDWSYHLLTPGERALLRRLSVHADGCTLAAAEAVGSGDGIDPGEVLDLLTRLVGRSLVTVTRAGTEPRFRLLESVAAYSAERLDEAGETAAVRRRHAEHYTRLAEEARPHLHGHGQGRWLAVLDTESANLRAVDDADWTPRLVDALTWYWALRGRFTEAERRLTAELERGGPDRLGAWRWGMRRLRGISGEQTRDWTPEAPPESTVDGRTLWFLAYAQTEVVDYASARALTERALEALRAEGDEWGVAAALAIRAVHRFGSGAVGDSERDAQESMAIFDRLGDDWGRLRAIYPLACVAEVNGDYEAAGRLHARGLTMAEELGLWREAADRMCGLGRIALLNGDLAASRRLHEQALRTAVEHRHHNGEVSAEIGLGLTARRAGDLAEAERHLHTMLAWGSEYDFGPITTLMYAELGFVAELRGDADEARRLHAEGLAAARRLDDTRAIALALEGGAGAEALAGDAVTAARLLGRAAAMRTAAGTPLPPGERGDVERIAGKARELLGEKRFAAEYELGAEEG